MPRTANVSSPHGYAFPRPLIYASFIAQITKNVSHCSWAGKLPKPQSPPARKKILATSTVARSGFLNSRSIPFLFCERPMLATCSVKDGRRYRYYICHSVRQRSWRSCPTKVGFGYPHRRVPGEPVAGPAEPRRNASRAWARRSGLAGLSSQSICLISRAGRSSSPRRQNRNGVGSTASLKWLRLGVASVTFEYRLSVRRRILPLTKVDGPIELVGPPARITRV